MLLYITQGVINMCGGAKAAVPVPVPRPTHRPKLQGLYARVCLGARPRLVNISCRKYAQRLVIRDYL